MTYYSEEITRLKQLRDRMGDGWRTIQPEAAARMRLQNRFQTGLDIARYNAAIMRADMAAYDQDTVPAAQ